MTGILALNFGTMAIVWADTLALMPQGGALVEQRTSKVQAVAHWPGVITGAGDAAEVLRWHSEVSTWPTLDVAILTAKQERATLRTRYLEQHKDEMRHQHLVHVGWSTTHRRTGLVILHDREPARSVASIDWNSVTIPDYGDEFLPYDELAKSPLRTSRSKLAQKARVDRGMIISSDCIGAIVSERRVRFLAREEFHLNPATIVDDELMFLARMRSRFGG